MQFDGLRVLSLESRRSAEIEKLIRARGGEPFVAPSMREIPLQDNPEAFAFATRLFAGEFDMMILLTGVGSRLLNQILETRYPAGSFADALRKLAVVVRGSKPMAVMREWDVPVAVSVPEPNTWREILAATEARPERKIAVQEYGRSSPELLEGLRARGAQVTTVPVYQWDLPEDIGPLREAVRRLAAGQFDVAMFTTSIQIPHLLRIAAEESVEDQVRTALRRMVVASVGPTTSETLRENGLPVDFEPSHPKMGFLVNETAQRAREILQSKQ
ncbi:MAG: Uroporphyrinogen synthase [Bryobacterales bacterium]|nr:Uroporphyrinogen synthase [Bryobacterales bacterium]